MPDKAPAFLVNPYVDPVVIRINGRADFLNSGPLREFFAMLVGQGRRRILVDFSNCTSVDSTFLGIVAGAALELADLEPSGEMQLSSLSTRNLELVRNLGLARVAKVTEAAPQTAPEEALSADRMEREERVRMILDAHKKLIQCDEANAERFQDVITFMRKRVGREEVE
jgi:anti-anti-sigma regulatory factor